MVPVGRGFWSKQIRGWWGHIQNRAKILFFEDEQRFQEGTSQSSASLDRLDWCRSPETACYTTQNAKNLLSSTRACRTRSGTHLYRVKVSCPSPPIHSYCHSGALRPCFAELQPYRQHTESSKKSTWNAWCLCLNQIVVTLLCPLTQQTNQHFIKRGKNTVTKTEVISEVALTNLTMPKEKIPILLSAPTACYYAMAKLQPADLRANGRA